MGVGLGLCTEIKQIKSTLMDREGAENDLLVRQCTFVHVAAYCHTRDATQRCQFILRIDNMLSITLQPVLRAETCSRIIINY